MTSHSEHLPSDLDLRDVKLDADQAHKSLAVAHLCESMPVTAARELVYLRDRVLQLEAHNATLERSNKRLREKLDGRGA